MKNVFITVITVGVCFWGGVLSAQEKERTAGNKQPNILIYFTDDVGWGDLGCYSNPFYETPNLDAFRKSGMKFTNAYVVKCNGLIEE